MRYLIENELNFGAGFTAVHRRLLALVQLNHESPLYLDYSISKQSILSRLTDISLPTSPAAE